MKCFNYTAPYIDELIKSAQQDPVVKDKKCAKALLEIIKDIKMFEVQGDDEWRSIWIEAERGKISDFGSYKDYLEEDIVTNHEEFIELWECYYPDEKKWCNLTFSSYENDCFLFFDSELTFHLSDEEIFEDNDSSDIALTKWLSTKINSIISRLKKDKSEYNKYISKNLPYKKRLAGY